MMTIRGKKIVAVIPARGGSKSIPRKNLAILAGRSLVEHAAAVCASIPWIDRAVLSTDDEEIADEGRRVGLQVPFMRPDELAGDLATSGEMWRHAWLASEEAFRTRFDISVLLEPTSPMRKAQDVELTVSAMLDGGHAAAVTVSRTPAHFTPHKTLKIGDNGNIEFYLPTGAQYSLRQAIPQYYHRNGICYAAMRETLIEKRVIIGESCHAVVIDRDVVNIDDPFDLELAEFLVGRT